MKVLVTGPDGLLGSNLIRELLSRGYSVTAMTENDKKSLTIENLPIQRIVANLLDAQAIINATVGIARTLADDVSIIRNVPIPQGSSLEFMGGNKIVLEPDDQVTVKSDVLNSLDISLSILEMS